MARYQPTAAETAAIDLLRLAGYAVVRQSTYDNLRQRIDIAEHRVEWEQDAAEHARAWARDCCREERRLTDRLNEVATAAAAKGVSIDAINEALHTADAVFLRDQEAAERRRADLAASRAEVPAGD